MRDSVLSDGRGLQRASRAPLPGPSRLASLAVLLLAFGLRLQELTRQNIWWDEARNIDVALRRFWQIPTAPELDIQPPVYYWLLHAWNGLFGAAIGQPPDALALSSRLLSVVAGVCGVALLAPLARRALRVGPGAAEAGVIAALVGALSPFWLAESQEARMYTVGFALLAGAALALLRHVEDQEPASERRSLRGSLRNSLPALAAFVLLAWAALLTHYNAVFVLVTWYAWWGVWALLRPDRWRQVGMAVGAGLAMTLLALPMLPIALRQIPVYENPNITIPSVADYLWQNWQAYAGGYAFDPALLGGSGSLWLWVVLAVAAAGAGVAAWAAWRGSDGEARTSRQSMTFLLAWLTGSLALYYVAVLDRNAFNVRYASFVTPALYALLGVGLAAYGRWWRPLPAVGVALLLVGLAPAVQADLYDARYDREHTAEAAEWLRANSQPGDIIFVDQKYPFGFYYQPYEIPGGETEGQATSEDGPEPARYLFVDINTIDQRLNEWASDARRVFWLQWFESDTDPRKAVRFLLDKHGRHAGEQTFQGYTLEWWELDPPTRFELAPNLQPARFAFPPVVETAAISLPDEALQPGDPLPVAIRWQRTAGEAAPKSYKARVALYDANGGRLVQSDERLLNDRHRAPWQWQAGDQPLNVYMLPLPPDLAPGSYSVGLLVYDGDTLEPLTLVDGAGNPVGQEATIGTIEVTTQ